MKKVLIYLRVSTAMQEEKDSLLKQKQEALTFVASKGFETYKIIEEVESGRKTERKGLLELEYEIKNRKFDVLVFYSLSRLGRVQYDIHKIINMTQKNGISYYSITESYISSETEVGKIMLGVMASLAEQESFELSKRVKGRMKFYAAQGHFLQKPPLGYDIKEKILIPNEEAEIIKDIFNSYLTGETKASIARRYNMYPTTVFRILSNKVYSGQIQFGERTKEKHTGKTIKVAPQISKGLHEPLISQEIFEQVQVLQARQYSEARKITNNRYLLSGLVFCSCCGNSFFPRKTYDKNKNLRKQIYYCCSGIKKKLCSMPYIDVHELEISVISAVKEEAEKGFLFLDTQDITKKNLENKIKSKKLLEKKDRILETYEDGFISRDEYLRKIKKIEAEILVSNQKEKTVEEINDLRKHFINLLENFDSVSHEEKTKILSLIIKEVIIHRKSEFELKLNLI